MLTFSGTYDRTVNEIQVRSSGNVTIGGSSSIYAPTSKNPSARREDPVRLVYADIDCFQPYVPHGITGQLTLCCNEKVVSLHTQALDTLAYAFLVPVYFGTIDMTHTGLGDSHVDGDSDIVLDGRCRCRIRGAGLSCQR